MLPSFTYPSFRHGRERGEWLLFVLLVSPNIALLLAFTFTLVHAFFWTDMRMRAPLVGVIALTAAAGGSYLAANARRAKPLESMA